ncbi:hypothetical protein KVG29_08670 [Caldicoprobacter algeriensis]|uniref:hypothetical protein n=1 Tax=Caldicoprobacter algeriensis TaxID=699281 RepID=UPI002079205D|nr:hypothetical protein [Caldicoprobacter algeriensis]MCM8901291.1 hypothetical protein [Caldicoprobacter algeriensis]
MVNPKSSATQKEKVTSLLSYKQKKEAKTTNDTDFENDIAINEWYNNIVIDNIIPRYISDQYLKSSMRRILSEVWDTYSQTASTKEGGYMDWQEKYLDKLDRDVAEMKASLRNTEDRIAQMINQALTEMRDRDNQRHQEFLEVNRRIEDIRREIKGDRQWIAGIAIATIIGIAAMIVSVLIK